jgi:HPt (histidine-containing phosphotransfer) domain-containing protein
MGNDAQGMGSSQSTDKAMDSLQRAYADQLPDKIREAEGLYEALRRSPGDVESLRRLIRLTHNLAGSGATFGFPALGAAALALSEALQALLEGDDSKLAGHFPRLDGLIETLKRSFNAIHGLPTRPDSSPRSDVAPAAQIENRLIYLVEDDTAYANAAKSWALYYANRTDWLADDLAGSNRPWKVVFMHDGPYISRSSAADVISTIRSIAWSSPEGS